MRGGKPDSEAWHVHIGALEDNLRSKLLKRKLNPERGHGMLEPLNPDEGLDILLDGDNDEDLSSSGDDGVDEGEPGPEDERIVEDRASQGAGPAEELAPKRRGRGRPPESKNKRAAGILNK